MQITFSTDSSMTGRVQFKKLGGDTKRSRLLDTTPFIFGDKTSHAQDFGVKNSKVVNEMGRCASRPPTRTTPTSRRAFSYHPCSNE